MVFLETPLTVLILCIASGFEVLCVQHFSLKGWVFDGDEFLSFLLHSPTNEKKRGSLQHARSFNISSVTLNAVYMCLNSMNAVLVFNLYSDGYHLPVVFISIQTRQHKTSYVFPGYYICTSRYVQSINFNHKRFT